MKTCRVIITTKCNLSCEYCCNKLQGVQDKFQMRTVEQIGKMNYDVFNITGGEPMLAIEKMVDLCRSIKGRKFLYTNGLYLNKSIISLCGFSGVNIGIHSGNIEELNFFEIKNTYRGLNVRLQVEDNNPELKRIEGYARAFGFGLTTWTRNDCESNDDWYIC